MSEHPPSPLPNGVTAPDQIGVETPGVWNRISTTQTMHDGTVLLTWGVQVSGTQQWVGKAHAIGPSLNEKAESFANAGLFAASKDMAVLLMEAVQAWDTQFDETDPDSVEIDGGDLLQWFAEWRLRARKVVSSAVTP
ncbi:MAG: hypothetical protein KGH75_01670 [Rhodospirillales bacterium]|nr:hypothetical protein [Rhodospirillales bacterium]